MIGRTLGHYRLVEKLGEGGMGVVYRAQDTRLGRDVAIKALTDAFARDPERLARFQREAQALAALNHSNIAAIHGFEEYEGRWFLVMEYVPGEVLRGPLPVDEALHACRQIADALEAAHEKGIVHRDLKPANIKLTPEGKIKVLDFGLARIVSETAESNETATALSPAATRAGVVMGTAAYMSPEQARGKPVDKRADIWAFGCVLYELLAGRQAFSGETISDMMASVLKSEPDWNALPPGSPVRLLRRCLEKDPARRLRDIGDARFDWEEPDSEGPAISTPVAAPVTPRQLRWAPWILAALLAGVAAWGWLHSSRGAAPLPVTRVIVPMPPKEALDLYQESAVALSPDGTRLVFVAGQGGDSRIYLREMDRFEATPIPGTEKATGPFFSPDGESLGFFAEGKLKTVSLKGGAAVALCDAPVPRGGSWGFDGSIIFCGLPAEGLKQIRADGSDGGKPHTLTTPDKKKGEYGHRWPHILPGGQAVLFTFWAGASFGESPIGVLSLKTGKYRTVVQAGTYPQYAVSGHLVYARPRELMAAPFDLDRLEVTGPAVPMVQDVPFSSTRGAAQFSLSRNGNLVYALGGSRSTHRTLGWVNRKGVMEPLPAQPKTYLFPRLSPDGRSVVVGVESSGVWSYDLARGALSLVKGSTVLNAYPIWTPDSKRVVFRGESPGINIFWIAADGSGGEEEIAKNDGLVFPGCWSPDGKVLAFMQQEAGTAWDIWTLSMDGERKPQPLLKTPANEGAACFSPNGKWLVYVSDESKRNEVYVRPYPGPGAKIQISTEGGAEPVWSRDGRELFYLDGNKMMVVPVQTKAEFVAGKPQLLFEQRYERASQPYITNYDVSLDGQRFLMIKSDEQAAPTELNVVLNWVEELKRRVPAGK